MTLDIVIKVLRHVGVIGLAIILSLIVGYHAIQGTTDRYTNTQAEADKALSAAHRERLAAEIAAVKAAQAKTGAALHEQRLMLERVLAEVKRNSEVVDEIKQALRTKGAR